MATEVEPVYDGPCCPWPINPDCCPGWPPDPADWTPAHELAVAEATDVLWRLTFGRYGECAEQIRPCRSDCAADQNFPFWDGYGWGAGGLLSPYMDGAGRWFNKVCGCSDDCGCSPLCVIELPEEVNCVVEVNLNGTVLDPSEYKVDKRPGKSRLIRRSGGGECWPTCQDLAADPGQDNTFTVTYMRGRKVPAGGVRAVTLLACELYKLCANLGGCRIPIGIKTIQREGLTYDMLPPGGWLETLQQEIPEAYRWLSLVNPHGFRQPSAVFSLDVKPAPMSTRGRIAGQPCDRPTWP